jgi:hypothetical protein
MTQRKSITYAEVKPGNVLLVECFGRIAERQVAVCIREGSYVVLVFHHLLSQFRFYAESKVELVYSVLCSSCGQPNEFMWACTRPVEKFLRVKIEDLKPGDSVCRSNEIDPKPGSYATVVSVQRINSYTKEPTDNVFINTFRVTIAIHRAKRPDREKYFDVHWNSTIRRATSAPCAIPVCENCAQDPADGHKWCPRHWSIRTLEVAA